MTSFFNVPSLSHQEGNELLRIWEEILEQPVQPMDLVEPEAGVEAEAPIPIAAPALQAAPEPQEQPPFLALPPALVGGAEIANHHRANFRQDVAMQRDEAIAMGGGERLEYPGPNPLLIGANPNAFFGNLDYYFPFLALDIDADRVRLIDLRRHRASRDFLPYHILAEAQRVR